MKAGAISACALAEDLGEFQLGAAKDGRKRFRDGKFYRRRKCWLA